jgi:poly(A) polymerase
MVEPLVISRPEHNVSRQLLDSDAVRILYRLSNAGYEAYVVGGAIRDMLRGRVPKDIDIATDASPNEIRRIFRNSRIIGRRFRLVHIYFGDKNIEVATLRAKVEPDQAPDDEDDLYVSDDNLWGDVESDAFRRDFTINALYYDIADFSIIDYLGGVADLRAGLVRSIGDPGLRFREDPVRMLRAVKFAARFGFTIEAETDRAIREWNDEILKASQFRVTEELFRIITQKNRHTGLQLLRDYGFLDLLWGQWLEAIGDEGFAQVLDYFQRINQAGHDGRYVPLEMTAAGLFLPLLDSVDIAHEHYQDCCSRLVQELQMLASSMDLPKRMLSQVTTLLRGQYYLLFFAHRRKQVQRFVRRPEFDWVWRLNDLAFAEEPSLHPLQELWLREREATGQELIGWVDQPDARDIFSFRGKTGGGRLSQGEHPGVIKPHRGRRRRSRR